MRRYLHKYFPYKERYEIKDINDVRHQFGLMEHIERFEFASEHVRGKVVIDAACGSGIGTRALLNGGAQSILGFDISEDCIRIARQFCSNPRIKFRVQNILFPISDGCDVFVSLETVEHLPYNKLNFYFGTVVGCLKEDGVFIVSTPNRSAYLPGSSIDHKPANPYHKFEFDYAEFREYLEKYFGEVHIYSQIKMNSCRYLYRTLDILLSRFLRSDIIPKLLKKFGYYKIIQEENTHNYCFLLAVCKKPQKTLAQGSKQG